MDKRDVRRYSIATMKQQTGFDEQTFSTTVWSNAESDGTMDDHYSVIAECQKMSTLPDVFCVVVVWTDGYNDTASGIAYRDGVIA